MDADKTADTLVDLSRVKPFDRPWLKWLAKPLEMLLCLDRLNEVYALAKQGGTVDSFVANYLRHLRITTEILERDLARIPQKGPVLVVANHPFGGIEGLLLPHILRAIRPDVRFMANFLLAHVKPMEELFFLVDPFNRTESARINVKGLKQCLGWLKGGGCLIVFPAGEVASFDPRQRKVVEPPWDPTIARIARHQKCQVVPMFFKGHNSALFHMAGLIHPRLRTALLAREVFQKSGKKIEIRVGRPIPSMSLNSIGDDAAIMDYLRMRTYMLENRTGRKGSAGDNPSALLDGPEMKAVNDPEPRDLVAAEIAALTPEDRLVDADEYTVYCAPAERIPNAMKEIGRLRELTFRATGEGTGKAIDLDEFDSHYLHLFVWKAAKQEIVGAYRLGRTDEILKTHGKHGLYTSTLFDYSTHLLEQIGPALEMGRSFVRTEYQRSYMPLFLLLKGIGNYVQRNPRYKVLFGPVSISNDYQTISRQIMVQFLKLNNYAPTLARLVKPKVPFRQGKIKNWDAGGRIVKDIDDVSALIGDMEMELRGVPILLKQYLKMGGKMLGFNIDPNFRDVLDGLVMVDLTQTDRRIMEKYIGEDGVKKFLEFHGVGV